MVERSFEPVVVTFAPARGMRFEKSSFVGPSMAEPVTVSKSFLDAVPEAFEAVSVIS